MTHPRSNPLLLSLPPLEEALAAPFAGREHEWAEQVGRALATVETVLQRHARTANRPDGPLAEVDRTRPGLDRQARRLEHDLTALAQNASTLLGQLRGAGEAFAPSAGPQESSLISAGARAIPDFGQLRQQIESLVAELRGAQKEEIGLVQESVTTDLGAGD
jgi:hypothetical protein